MRFFYKHRGNDNNGIILNANYYTAKNKKGADIIKMPAIQG